MSVAGEDKLQNKVVSIVDADGNDALGGGGGTSDYSDLTNKPQINSVTLTDNKSASDLGLATAAQGTKADTAYQKPASGIPDTDLSSAVQTSLGKADTALQSFTETDPVFSASPAAGITSGDISNWNGKADPIPEVDATTPPASMNADTFYDYGTLSGDTTFPPLASAPVDGKAHVYWWGFTTPATAPNIGWPTAIIDWNGGKAPTIDVSTYYEITVKNGIAAFIKA